MTKKGGLKTYLVKKGGVLGFLAAVYALKVGSLYIVCLEKGGLKILEGLKSGVFGGGAYVASMYSECPPRSNSSSSVYKMTAHMKI